MTRGKGTDKAVALFCQELLRQAEASGRESKEIARVAGVSPSLISQIKNKGEGVGFRAAAGVAKAFGMTLGELFEKAEAWAAGSDEPVEKSPNRAEAAKFAKVAGLSRAAIESVLGWPVAQDPEPTALEWLERIKNEDARLTLIAVCTAFSRNSVRTAKGILWTMAHESRIDELQAARLRRKGKIELAEQVEQRSKRRRASDLEHLQEHKERLARMTDLLERYSDPEAFQRDKPKLENLLTPIERSMVRSGFILSVSATEESERGDPIVEAETYDREHGEENDHYLEFPEEEDDE